MLEPARTIGDQVEANLEPVLLRMSGEPRIGGGLDAPCLDVVDHLERVAEGKPSFDLTSQKIRRRPRRTTRSSSPPASQQFASRIR